MPPPPAVDAVADELVEVYRRTMAAVEAELARVAAGVEANPLLWRRRDRLNELRATISDELDRVDDAATDWLRTRFPVTYGIGAIETTQATGGTFAWTQFHIDAVASLATELHGDLLKATRAVRREVKAVVRQVVRARTTEALVGGKTAVQAGREATFDLLRRGIATVRYKGGARVPVDAYAQMAVRSTTGVAYNLGALRQGRVDGVLYAEVLDGADCGWIGHDDTDKANGTIRPIEECEQASISHPNCRRVCSVRPDILTEEQARDPNNLSTTPEERADQAAAERAQAEASARRTRGRAATRARERRSRGRQPVAP